MTDFAAKYNALPKVIRDNIDSIVTKYMAETVGLSSANPYSLRVGIALGFEYAREYLEIMERLEADQYQCRACGAKYGIELPFPEENPTCTADIDGDQGSLGEGTCNYGLIVKPSEGHLFGVWVVAFQFEGAVKTHEWFYHRSGAIQRWTEVVEASDTKMTSATMFFVHVAMRSGIGRIEGDIDPLVASVVAARLIPKRPDTLTATSPFGQAH